MEQYDALPQFLRAFYGTYNGSMGMMKEAHIAWHFDDPVDPILNKQVDKQLKLHEMLFDAIVHRRPSTTRTGELYHKHTGQGGDRWGLILGVTRKQEG